MKLRLAPPRNATQRYSKETKMKIPTLIFIAALAAASPALASDPWQAEFERATTISAKQNHGTPDLQNFCRQKADRVRTAAD